MPVYKVSKERISKDKRQYFFKVSYRKLDGSIKKYTSKLFLTKQEAVKEEARFLLEKNKISENNLTINEVFEIYLSNKEKEIKPQSLEKIKNQYKYIRSSIGNIKINKLTTVQYMQFKNELDNTLSITYKNKIHQLIKAIYTFAIKHYGVSKNIPEIVGNFKNTNTIKKEIDFFTLEEFNLFYTKLNNIVWEAYFLTLFYCGLRKNEANALNWNDIDFYNKTININKNVVLKLKGIDYILSSPKTSGSIRKIPVPNIVLDKLLNLKQSYNNDKSFKLNNFVFGNKKPLAETTIAKIKNDACNKANLKQIRIHDFRHSCASLLINNGANITLVSKYLGHSDIQMTLNTYSHFYKSQMEELPILLDKLSKKVM